MSTLSSPLPDFPTTLPPPPPEAAASHRHHHHGSVVIHSVLAGVSVFVMFIVFAIVYRKMSRKRTVPADLKSPPPQAVKEAQLQQFSYNVLRRATSAFAVRNRLGQGGFGSVYKGVLPSGKEIAVKLMNGCGSLQGEREFHNELSLSTRVAGACGARAGNVISVLGYCCDVRCRRKKKMMIVYEFMQNGSLQDALLYRKCAELMDWKIRFRILLDVAKGIDFLHCSCDPPIVHCDIKPSNVLLDRNFNAKIADFGLAKVLGMDESEVVESFIECGEEEGDLETDTVDGDNSNKLVIEESESVVTTGEVVVNVDPVSPESCCVTVVDADASPSEYLERASVSDQISVDSSNRRVKDYVMEWIGSEIKKERPKKDWLTSNDPVSSELDDSSVTTQQKKQKKKSESDKKNRKPREWWKEEFCDELHRRRNSQECPSGEIPKSGGISSTPSMRGTVCYIAPEKCDGGLLSEKSDVYSYGVLILVLVSGRRPLQVTASPMSEFERANLISWARQLARNGKLLDLVDPSIHSLDQEQALLCVTTALLCLQRSPAKRPTMTEIVGMLSGESEPPHLPFEFSPSPPTNIPFKSRRKPRTSFSCMALVVPCVFNKQTTL
ncbi:protein kinase superfamily protein [Artemisia annua]|uniref:non-specific serine/threonine protein kinase n=1 Tax=Artemisia annua TaxID=35608 RepID=A0A2U1PYP6_ARTAN|nr:protein kinase superfamily protein [Artemisia annua]